jgi:hypothetical protein
MKARKMLFFQQDNGFTLLSEQRRDRGASGAATNDNDIALSTIIHCKCRLRTADWEAHEWWHKAVPSLWQKRFRRCRSLTMPDRP